jgi:hypothetical protein
MVDSVRLELASMRSGMLDVIAAEDLRDLTADDLQVLRAPLSPSVARQAVRCGQNAPLVSHGWAVGGGRPAGKP